MSNTDDQFFFVYIMASNKDGTLYLGRTNDIWERVAEHKRGEGARHSAKYKCFKLVWFEWFDHEHSAFMREKRMKKWIRDFKVNLIVQLNPDWLDLTPQLTEEFVFDPIRQGPYSAD